MLLLNKVDLLSEQEQQQLRALLHKLNPSAKVHTVSTAQHSNVILHSARYFTACA